MSGRAYPCFQLGNLLAIRMAFNFAQSNTAMSSVYDFEATSITGQPVKLSDFRGKVILIVNTASKCGFTPQYEGLEALWLKYKDKGLVVLGVPSNDFGGQEPGKASEIATFCKVNYGVTFPLADKTVVSGKQAHPFYVWAASKAGMLGSPKWNFHKYLINRNGEVIGSYKSSVSPTSPEMTQAIRRALDAHPITKQ